MKILVIDDDPDLLPLIAYALRQAGYLALEAPTGERGMELLTAERPDLVILDLNLPGIDGLEVCRRMREDRSRTPILMLTVRTAEESQVQGLDAGADDYLTKPFSPRTLMARVRALLRRVGYEQGGRVEFGGVELDNSLRAIRLPGAPPIRLTTLEFRLMQILVAHSGTTVSADSLMRHVWGSKSYGDRQHLKQLVHRLRQKLEVEPAHPRILRTVSGIGYSLHADSLD